MTDVDGAQREMDTSALSDSTGPVTESPDEAADYERAADPNRPPAVSVRGLTKQFGTVTAVDNVSLEIEAGSIVGLLGPNGAGKTTLIKSILGMVLPDTGTVAIDGIDVQRQPRAAYAHVDAMLEGEVEGIELAPAGEAVVGEGHLHVLVDHEGFEEGETIPGPAPEAEEDGIYHWGDGQSEGEIELEPGEYDLTLIIGDGPHRAYGEADEITITVEENSEGDDESDDEE